MDKNEPAFVPQWLKSNGSSLNQHSSSGNSDSVKSRSYYSNGGNDSPRSVFLDSSYFNRKLPGNGARDKSSFVRNYSSFSRSNRDKDWDEDLSDFCTKERWFQRERRDRCFTPSPYGMSANSCSNRNEKNVLRRSQSMISGKRDELSSRRGTDLTIGNNNDNGDVGGISVESSREVALERDFPSLGAEGRPGTHIGGISVVSSQEAALERDFPSLGAEGRPGTPNIARALSPSLSSSLQSFPVGASAVAGYDGWNSALVEVPPMPGGSSILQPPIQQPAPASFSSVASSTGGLNMAGALGQAPSRAHSPQLSVETQRLEELAIKQSRQLIPVTSLVPKTSVLKSEKPKLRPAARSEIYPTSKNGHHQLSSPHLVNHTLHSGNAKSDIANSCHVGKLLVLKPAQEKKGISSVDKDGPINSGRTANNPSVVAPTVAPPRSSSNPKDTATQQKTSIHPTIYTPVEKRSTISQAQSRNDFFKLMRKKSSTNLSSAPADSDSALSTIDESSGGSMVEIAAAVKAHASEHPSSDPFPHDVSTGNGTDMVSNTDAFEDLQTCPNNGNDSSIPVDCVWPHEEEKAFLHSMGWVESTGEDEPLTEEEINSFYKMYMQVNASLKPSLKTNPKLLPPKPQWPQTNHLDSFHGDELSSSDSDSDFDA